MQCPYADIVEGVNLMDANQMAIHTLDGCTTNKGINQSGSLGSTDCSSGSGCTVRENKADSFGEGFANAGGGVWATQFDVAGVFIWFWSVSTISSAAYACSAKEAPTDATNGRLSL